LAPVVGFGVAAFVQDADDGVQVEVAKTGLEIRKRLHQQIDLLRPELLNLLAEFLAFLQFKRVKRSTSVAPPTDRQPGLHPGAFVISDDFDAPLPDSFWLGEE
jgi:hypothetical protein